MSCHSAHAGYPNNAMIRLLALASTAVAFTPWARNDSAAYVFREHVDGVLEKRRRKLDALRKKGGDALIRDAVGRGLHWNALGVAFPRDSRDEVFAKFAQTVVAHQPVDRAMLRHDASAGRRLAAANAMHSARRRLAAHDAARAIQTLHDSVLHSRSIFVREDREPAASPIGQGSPTRGFGRGVAPAGGPPGNGCQVFVGNLPWDVAWQALKDHFRAAGNVVHADVMVDVEGRSRGFGTVLFSNTREAAKAIQLFNESFLLGRQIEVRPDQHAR